MIPGDGVLESIQKAMEEMFEERLEQVRLGPGAYRELARAAAESPVTVAPAAQRFYGVPVVVDPSMDDLAVELVKSRPGAAGPLEAGGVRGLAYGKPSVV